MLIVLIASAAAGAADEPAPGEKSPEASPMRRRPAIVEMERSAMAFAREHHPELAQLLDRLRRANPRAYRAAMQDLTKDRLRLERLRQRAPERYESDLKLWRMDSRIRLLAARAAKGNADELRPELMKLLQERQEFRLQRLRQEQERLSARLDRIAGEIQRIESQPASDADIDALLARVKDRVDAVQKKAVAPAGAGATTEPSRTGADPAPPTQTNSFPPQD